MISLNKFLKHSFCNFYKTLNVQQNATNAQIKKNFNDLAKKYHPDLAQEPNEQFIKIKKAYDTLKDPESRKQYDFQLIHGNASQRRKYRYYYPEQNSNRSSQQRMKYNILLYLNRLGVAILAVVLLQYLLQPMTQHEIRRQNIILANQPIDSGLSVQEKRRKIFKQQMKQKQVTSRYVDVKTSTGAAQSTKAKSERKNSIQSIEGINKEISPCSRVPTEQYM